MPQCPGAGLEREARREAAEVPPDRSGPVTGVTVVPSGPPPLARVRLGVRRRAVTTKVFSFR